MHLFYDPTLSRTDKLFCLSEDESKHACKVMRLKEGDSILLINGLGDEFTAIITDAHPKKCALEIVSVRSEEKPPYAIHIAIAPTKNSDRLEWFIEKATEIGVTEITLLACDKSERKVQKRERLEKILVSAIKQSKRLFLPQLNEIVSTTQFIETHPNGLIAHCYDETKVSIQTAFQTNNCPILIGPEGDFSLKEVEAAQKHGYKTIHLGENRLRTETAGLYACMQAKLICDAIQ